MYYKVTGKNLKSVIKNNSDFTVQYKIGEFVQSPFPETPLCVFDTYENAKRFGLSQFRSKIFECKIKTKLKIPWIPKLITWYSVDSKEDPALRELLKLIKQKKPFLHTDLIKRILPKGTVCCKQVKLLRELTDVHHTN